MRKSVKKSKENFNRYVIKTTKKQLKTNTELQDVIKVIKTHFKKHNWKLRYQAYQKMSRVECSFILSTALHLNGFGVKYSKKDSDLVIYKKK